MQASQDCSKHYVLMPPACRKLAMSSRIYLNSGAFGIVTHQRCHTDNYYAEGLHFFRALVAPFLWLISCFVACSLRINGHTDRQTVCPFWPFACVLLPFRLFLSSTSCCSGCRKMQTRIKYSNPCYACILRANNQNFVMAFSYPGENNAQ